VNWNGVFRTLDTGIVPDGLVRFGIRRLLRRRLEELQEGGVEGQRQRFEQLVRTLRESPIAVETDKANEQHYELPPDFFQLALGRHLKYSCGYWDGGVDNLDDAEEAMLRVYAERARLTDGMDVLDLGCGWGSLSLWLAERYPRSSILALSNSQLQREFIEARARERGLENLRVRTEDVNRFQTKQRFDRIVSIEMFEHMRNYRELMRRVSGWLREDGYLFVHIFTHDRHAYPFDTEGEDDWMGRHFFTGGLMPSHDLLLRFQDDVVMESEWQLSGRHYQKTADAWLKNLDHRATDALRTLTPAYGLEARKWLVRWRVFFMACSELWGFRGGQEWTVSHYLFRPRTAKGAGASWVESRDSTGLRERAS
jgi:cyclopropane-fatty-acyl-phospholipid synthase